MWKGKTRKPKKLVQINHIQWLKYAVSQNSDRTEDNMFDIERRTCMSKELNWNEE